MEIRKKFNQEVRKIGNRVREGLGEALTKEIDLRMPLTIAGTAAVIATTGQIICSDIYNLRIPEMMNSNNFVERLAGYSMEIPISLFWAGVILPFSITIGTNMGYELGERLNKL